MNKKKEHAETKQRMRTEKKESKKVDDIRWTELKSHEKTIRWTELKEMENPTDPEEDVNPEVLNVHQEP